MEALHRIDVKVFATKGADIDAYDFMIVMQRWIQQHKVPGVLIDVADYSHMHHGPGVILVGHEHNISVDYADGKMGLLFRQKTPVAGSPSERIRAATVFALTAATLLQAEPEFMGRLAFDLRQLLVIANDRLNAPTVSETSNAFRIETETAMSTVYSGNVVVTSPNGDPRGRAEIDVRAENEPNPKLLVV